MAEKNNTAAPAEAEVDYSISNADVVTKYKGAAEISHRKGRVHLIVID